MYYHWDSYSTGSRPDLVECQLRDWVVGGGGSKYQLWLCDLLQTGGQQAATHISIRLRFFISSHIVTSVMMFNFTVKSIRCPVQTCGKGRISWKESSWHSYAIWWDLGTPLSGEGSNILGGVRQMKDMLGCKMAAVWASGMITFTPPCLFLSPCALWIGFLRLSPSWLVSS